jgi:AraC-like DNA-binding protein
MTPSTTVGEDAFLNAVNCFIEKNLSKKSFTIKEMTRQIGMSRTDLHRKLKQKTGESVTRFIKRARILHAKRLLSESPKSTICAVGYEVGFDSPSYFTRVFKEIEGIGPRAFRARYYSDTGSLVV